MIFFAITPILIGAFGNYCIPLMIGARDMAFPWLNMLSFWTFLLSQLLVLASFFGAARHGRRRLDDLPAALHQRRDPRGRGRRWWWRPSSSPASATIMGGINYITTVIRLRAPGMTYMRMPLTIWGLWLTAILNVLFVPVLGSAALLLAPRSHVRHPVLRRRRRGGAGRRRPASSSSTCSGSSATRRSTSSFSRPGASSRPLSFFARKPAYWYKGSVYAMSAVTVLSRGGLRPPHVRHRDEPAARAGLHDPHADHQRPGRDAVPELAAHHLEGVDPAAPRRCCSRSAMVFVFGLGGLTGHLPRHDLHRPLPARHDVRGRPLPLHHGGGLVPRGLRGDLLLVPQDVRPDDERDARQDALLVHVVGITLVFGGQLVVGYSGQQRRLYEPVPVHVPPAPSAV